MRSSQDSTLTNYVFQRVFPTLFSRGTLFTSVFQTLFATLFCNAFSDAFSTIFPKAFSFAFSAFFGTLSATPLVPSLQRF